MRRRTGAMGTLIALAAIVPLADTAHAQDLDCGDFTYQEDAQVFFDTDRSDPHRLDEDPGPDDGVACEALPRRGLTSSTFRPAPTTSAPASVWSATRSLPMAPETADSSTEKMPPNPQHSSGRFSSASSMPSRVTSSDRTLFQGSIIRSLPLPRRSSRSP